MFRQSLTVAAVLGLLVAGVTCAGAMLVNRAQAGDSSNREQTRSDMPDRDSVETDSRPIPPRSSDTAPKAPGKKGGAKNREKASDGGWWTTLGGLIAVLALIFLSAKLLKKGVPAAQRTLPAEVVEVLGRKALDYRHTIHLVRFGSRMLMIGTSQEGMSTLSEVTDRVEIDYLAGLCKPGETTSVAQGFQQLFQRFRGAEALPPEALPPTARATDTAPAPEDEVDEETDSDPAILRLQERLQQAQRADLSSRPDQKSGHSQQATEVRG
jgi:flagellar biogenesis protein FliO